MRVRAGSFAFFVTLAACLTCAMARAQAPTLINFQGKLLETDGTPVNGSVDIVFRIHTTQTGDTNVWSESHTGPAAVNVNKGLFSVLLGVTSPITPDILDHTQCWLEMEVDSEIMSPRQQLVSVAFAQVAAKAAETDETLQDVAAKGNTITLDVPGAAGDPPTIGAAVTVTNGSTADYSVALHALTTDLTGNNGGIFAESLSVNGAGLSATGGAMGVYSVTTSTNGGFGVLAEANCENGRGVYGRTSHPDGYGVYGENSAGTSTTCGVYGYAASTDGYGVYSQGKLHSTGSISSDGGLVVIGDVVLGDSTTDTVAFGGRASTDIDPNVSGLDLGDAALRWSLFADEIDTSSTALVANLNADTVDGKHVADLDTDYVNAGGDTMTGPLVLPLNGLVAGTDQLVLSGGNVGVGTAAPAEKLSVAGVVESTAGGVKFPDATVQTTAAVNQPPVALLKATRLSGDFVYPVVYELDATESYDPEGTATLQYSWDFVGQGEFGVPDVASLTPHSFAEGTHLPGVRVSDGSRIDESKVLVRVSRGLGVLDSAGDVGRYTSLCVVDGKPAVSYYDATYGDLEYVLALDAQGSAWGRPVSVKTSDNVGQFTSLCVVDGRPAISYYDFTNGDLKFVGAVNSRGSRWGTSVDVDSTADTVGLYTSLCVVGAVPAISYYDLTNGNLNYVLASSSSGSAWLTPVAVDTDDDVGAYTSLCVVNGNPAISYHDVTNGDLKYVRADDANGLSWSAAPIPVDSTPDFVGEHTSLCVVAGNPAISYYDDSNNSLKYVRANDANGSSWGTPIAVDGAAIFVGEYTSLCIVDGRPAISYYDSLSGDLKYVRADDALGTLWGTPVAVDTAGIVGQYTSLCVVDGRPAISYYDSTNGHLKYVRAP
ncbi:MAG: hypothetical protein ACYTKD_09790 [Planctomycetota bacterium]|jgi:hypothetical protein